MLKNNKIDHSQFQRLTLEVKMIKEGQHTAIKELYATGTPKRAIARLLGIDVKTVRRHLKKTQWTEYQRDSFPQRILLAEEQPWLIGRMPVLNTPFLGGITNETLKYSNRQIMNI